MNGHLARPLRTRWSLPTARMPKSKASVLSFIRIRYGGGGHRVGRSTNGGCMRDLRWETRLDSLLIPVPRYFSKQNPPGLSSHFRFFSLHSFALPGPWCRSSRGRRPTHHFLFPRGSAGGITCPPRELALDGRSRRSRDRKERAVRGVDGALYGGLDHRLKWSSLPWRRKEGESLKSVKISSGKVRKREGREEKLEGV